jgi:hypothetical protein
MFHLESELDREPISFVSDEAQARFIIIAQDLKVEPGNAYPKVLKAGSKWKYVGHTPRGSVYKVVDDVFSLQAKFAHEAYLVVSPNSDLVGFYLPVEESFVVMPSAVKLPIKKGE